MKDSVIGLGHGSGGRKTARLVKELFLKYLGNPILERLEDAAELPVERGRIALTTDAHVVEPLFFPGGDIGKLAVCGTANDLAVKGAKPRFMTAGFVLRAGISLDVLERIVASMAEELDRLGMKLIAGDTKVIEKGEKDECYITTTGFGVLEHERTFASERIEPGDAILVSGEVGNHEASVVLSRSNFGLKQNIRSDVAPVWPLVHALIQADVDIKVMRDPTRSGLATTLNELCDASGLGMLIHERDAPFNPEVKGVAEMLGLDPYYLASEGRLIAIVNPEDAHKALDIMRKKGSDTAGIIGEVRTAPAGLWLDTILGSERPLLILEGEQLPRIC